MRRTHELLPFALLAFACGATLREPLECAHPRPTARTPFAVHRTEDAAVENAGVEASFTELAALGATVALGMREVARVRSGREKTAIAHADGHDTCVRVAFRASTAIVGKLVDGEGNALASSGSPATDGVLGEEGPVCVRSGETVSAVAEGAPARILWVAWKSP